MGNQFASIYHSINRFKLSLTIDDVGSLRLFDAWCLILHLSRRDPWVTLSGVGLREKSVFAALK